jgi:hypothetical protein
MYFSLHFGVCTVQLDKLRLNAGKEGPSGAEVARVA